jgi:hypothetical protein
VHSRPVLAMTMLAIVLGATSASAAPLHWGPRLGVNASAFTGRAGDFIQPDLRWFPNLGLALQIDLDRHLAFRAEAAYSVKGGGTESEWTDASGNPIGTFKDTWRFEYIEVPLLVRARMPVSGGAKPYLEVGPTVAFTIGGEFESEATGVPPSNFRDELKDVDAGFSGGLGIELPAGRGSAALEARYTRGFSGVLRNSGALSMINQAWTLAASWLY